MEPNAQIFCDNCHKDITEEPRNDVGNESFCEECFDEIFILCKNCRELIDTRYEDSHESPEGDAICENCISDTVRCVICNELLWDNDTIYNENGQEYCQSCYDEEYTQCDGCSSELLRDEVYNYGRDTLCERCYENAMEEEGNDSRIREYDDRPRWKFHGTGPRFYGLEIEIEARDSVSDSVDAVLENFENEKEVSVMHDGSITEPGFEIISHPADYETVHKFADRFEALTESCKAFHASSCGMHIHFSKEGLSELVLAKFLLFFADNKELIEKIAQRGTTEYWKHEKIDDVNRKVRNPKDYERYEAINLGNDKTVEVRCFQSNLLTKRIKKNVQFVESLLEFCQNYELSNMKASKYKEFLNTVELNKYKEVREYVCNNS